MSNKVQRCFDLTTEIEKLSAERDQLEASLTDTEAEELITLLQQEGEVKLNEAAQLQAYRDVRRATEGMK